MSPTEMILNEAIRKMLHATEAWIAEVNEPSLHGFTFILDEWRIDVWPKDGLKDMRYGKPIVLPGSGMN